MQEALHKYRAIYNLSVDQLYSTATVQTSYNLNGTHVCYRVKM